MGLFLQGIVGMTSTSFTLSEWLAILSLIVSILQLVIGLWLERKRK